MKRSKPLIGVTMGDAAGSGPELILKALSNPDIQRELRIVIIGDLSVFSKAREITGLKKLTLRGLSELSEAVFEENVVNILDLSNVDASKLVYGRPSEMTGRAAAECIIKGVELASKGLIDALVTAPISKEGLNMAGYKYPGHTEFLAKLTNTKNYAMMLVVDDFRVVHVSTHVSLREAIELVRRENVLEKIVLTHEYLKRYFSIDEPRIAVSGLNPHASEGGLFGREEEEEIVPAIEEARRMGLNVSGPYPPDTVFQRAYNSQLSGNPLFDAVIAMYHDQGHIPVKMVGLMKGVNVTIGLPFIRTSPDHGTVWGKAGKGTANPGATIQAIKLAGFLAKNARNTLD